MGLYFAPLCGYFLFVIITIGMVSRRGLPLERGILAIVTLTMVSFPLKELGSQLILHIFFDPGVISEMLHQNHVTLDYTAALLRLVAWEQRGVSLVSGSAL